MFYNIPTATKLTAMFGLDPDAAFRAFRAWHATLDPTKTVDERVSRAERVCCYPPIYW